MKNHILTIVLFSILMLFSSVYKLDAKRLKSKYNFLVFDEKDSVEIDTNSLVQTDFNYFMVSKENKKFLRKYIQRYNANAVLLDNDSSYTPYLCKLSYYNLDSNDYRFYKNQYDSLTQIIDSVNLIKDSIYKNLDYKLNQDITIGFTFNNENYSSLPGFFQESAQAREISVSLKYSRDFNLFGIKNLFITPGIGFSFNVINLDIYSYLSSTNINFDNSEKIFLEYYDYHSLRTIVPIALKYTSFSSRGFALGISVGQNFYYDLGRTSFASSILLDPELEIPDNFNLNDRVNEYYDERRRKFFFNPFLKIFLTSAPLQDGFGQPLRGGGIFLQLENQTMSTFDFDSFEPGIRVSFGFQLVLI